MDQIMFMIMSDLAADKGQTHHVRISSEAYVGPQVDAILYGGAQIPSVTIFKAPETGYILACNPRDAQKTQALAEALEAAK